ncbi:MAG TPA: hypothetical protein VMU19_08770 [Bryobacteraceae bacterium]|nr:hypothetical protein [Bryobacteraceae bacterium]
MANRIRSFLESLIFAGLKPSGGAPDGPGPPKQSGWLRRKLDAYLSAGHSNDPLYLSNRTLSQKLRPWFLIGTPILLLLVGLALVLANVFKPKAAPPPKEPTAAEKIAHLLPDVDKLPIAKVEGVEVGELRVLHESTPKITGVVTNNTNSAISLDIDLDIANNYGSRVASVTEHVSDAQPHGTTDFEFASPTADAKYALVRKIRRSN